MTALVASGHDFVSRFPIPQDEALHQAGRQGLLDQKEDATQSGPDWVAFQHEAWAGELRGHLAASAYVSACLAARVNPHTGEAPRTAQAWAQIEDGLRSELLQLDGMVRGMLGDYADHFGQAAADAFAAHVSAIVPITDDIVSAQQFSRV